MARFVVVALLLSFIAVPAFGKGHDDIYPVSCSDLWDAVKDTLGVKGNYNIMAIDDSEMTASFFITGAVNQRVNTVALNEQDAGCKLQAKSGDDEYSEDARQFKKRVTHSLAKLQAAKPSGAPKLAHKN